VRGERRVTFVLDEKKEMGEVILRVGLFGGEPRGEEGKDNLIPSWCREDR